MILNEITEIDNICHNYISEFRVYCTETPKIFTTSLCFYTDIAIKNKILNIDDLRRLVSSSTSSTNNTYMSKYKYFKNCVLFKFNKTSIKVFTNGTVHVTGAKTICSAYHIIKQVMNDVFKHDDHILRYSIFMMNISLKIKVDHLDLDMLYERFVSMESAYYDKNKHAALKIKFPQTKMSILLFSSGSVLIMGNKNTNDIKKMLDWLKENLELTF